MDGAETRTFRAELFARFEDEFAGLPLGARRVFAPGGVAVQLDVRDAGLVDPLTRAFAHLTDVPEHGAVEIAAARWRGAPPSLPATGPSDFGPFGEVRSIAEAGAFAVVGESGALAFLDPDAGRAFWARGPGDALDPAEKAAPLRTLLGAILRRRGVHAVHAAAVAWRGRAALLVGEGGAGKTTTALASFAAGLDYLGDDYVAVADEPAPIVHSLYCSAKSVQNAALPFVDPARTNAGKAVGFVTDSPTPRAPAHAPLAAMFSLEFGEGEDTRVRPASSARLAARLVATTAAQTPGSGAGLLRCASRLARAIPCFTLALGRSRPGAADAIQRTLEGA